MASKQRKLICIANLLGHFCVLQVLLSVEDPKHFPPYISVTVLDRDLVCVPLPQLLEHVEYPLQLPHRQFTEKHNLL